MLNKKIIASVAIAATITFGSMAHAGSAIGTISRVLVQQPNFVFFSVGNISNPPACQGGSQDFSIDVSTVIGRSQYAFILTSQALGTELVVTGEGACNSFPDRESLNFVFSR